jgi:uncharacterized membrane protein
LLQYQKDGLELFTQVLEVVETILMIIGGLIMVNKHPMSLEEHRIRWIVRSLSRLKVLKHERIQLTRSVKFTDDPQFIADHDKYISLQYEILEEFFKQISRYLQTQGTVKTLAVQTLREIVSTLVC